MKKVIDLGPAGRKWYREPWLLLALPLLVPQLIRVVMKFAEAYGGSWSGFARGAFFLVSIVAACYVVLGFMVSRIFAVRMKRVQALRPGSQVFLASLGLESYQLLARLNGGPILSPRWDVYVYVVASDECIEFYSGRESEQELPTSITWKSISHMSLGRVSTRVGQGVGVLLDVGGDQVAFRIRWLTPVGPWRVSARFTERFIASVLPYLG